MGGIKMLNKNESHAGVCRQRVEKFLACFQPARRRADTNNRELSVADMSAIMSTCGQRSLCRNGRFRVF